MPELNRNILNFGYGINYKYERMLSHQSDRFYVVTKLILPTIEDITISAITFNMECSCSHIKLDKKTHAVKHLLSIRNICSGILPFIYYYKAC